MPAMAARRGSAAAAWIPIFLLPLLAAPALGDIYLHSPRGSNNKLNEVSNQATNENRLFDSQNNARGGYQVGDACPGPCLNATGSYDPTLPGAGKGTMEFYAGSELRIEWTAQHGSGPGNPNVESKIVLQYACEDSMPGLRDGTNTSTVPEAALAEPSQLRYGQHEAFEFWDACRTRERNRGLFTADQRLGGDTARYTRQNPAGTRYGFECAEERDYFPYWHPSPWRDVWICASDASQACPALQQGSQNIQPKGSCSLPRYNNETACTAGGGQWTLGSAWAQSPPACTACPSGRSNHLGTADGTSDMPSYTWTVPSGHADGALCVLRIRYNVSTADFPGDSTFAAQNGALSTDPRRDFVGYGEGVSGPLTLNVDTSQTFRVFEDRTHAFRIRAPPEGVARSGALRRPRFVNLNVRGRRGNIVQVYPSVEYDFVPSRLDLVAGDWLHVQWTGSDANPQGNEGNGLPGTDRSNLAVIAARGLSVPANVAGGAAAHFAPTAELAARFAYANQGPCNLSAVREDDRASCNFLNAASAYQNFPPFMVTRTGTYHFVGTRNHAFSNRDMKGTLTVATDWQTIGIAVAIAAVGCIVLALLAWWGLSVWAKRNPGGKVASCMTRKGKEELEIEAFADVKPWKMPAKAAAVPVAAAYKPAANGTVQAQAKETYANGYANGSAGLEASTGAVELSSVRGVQGTAAPVYRGSHNPVIPAGGMDTTYVPPLKPVPIPMVPGAVPDEAAPAADPEEGGGDLGEDRRVTCADRVAVWWNWHGPRMTIALIYLLANAGAFGFGIWSVSALIPFSSVYLPLAKGFGKTLDFNFAFLLFPVMKSLLGYLRGTPIAEVIPLWDAVSLHIFVAVLIVIGSVGHILMHYLNMLWEQKENGVPLVQPAVLTVAGFTGHLVTLLMLVLLVGTLFGRRITKLCCLRIDYSVFLIMHTLWIPVYGVLLIHGPSFWTFVLIPLLFMAAEKALQYRRREVEVEVSAADMVSADVLRLSMRHPGGRKVAFKPGQYIFLADPWVSGSRLEFHPFTISSAPEDDEMTVHIRVRKGFDWASKVKDHLLHVFAADPSAVTGQTYRTILPRLRIDGPYGAPAEDVWKFTHVILVGAGIGVTPFASVLRSISRRYNEHPMNVSFYWVCRDSKELDAFRDLMESTEQALGDGTAIELNVFLTADRDAHKREAVGRRWNLYPGRPSWPAIVKEKAMGSPGADFGVFFCGPIGFARDVERACRIATGYYRKQGSATTFRFYKESF